MASTQTRVEKIEHNIGVINTNISKVSSDVRTINEKMEKVYSALVGDKNFGQEGIVERLESFEKFKEKWEKKTVWMYGYMAGIGAAAALFIQYIKTLLNG